MVDVTTVTLENCEDEPIHLPGAIQPHGALLALSADGLVLARSENCVEWFGSDFSPASQLADHPLGAALAGFLQSARGASGKWSGSTELVHDGRTFDVIGHRYADVHYLELEERQAPSLPGSAFVHYAQDIIAQVQMHERIEDLLENVTRELCRMTGFDRVMAYRFRPDDSGEVVAESRREDLESYLGQRYPASDIPAQARRLYIQNPIRAIVDVGYEPVAVLPVLDARNGRPFDLTHSTLRSVSPVHCEYLRNMGVHASMSLSIVVQGRLWGLFSCHHMSAKLVPYPVRMAFQVFSQVCSAIVGRLEHNATVEALREAAERRLRLARRARDADDLVSMLADAEGGVRDLIPCDSTVVMLGGRIAASDAEAEAQALALLRLLAADPQRDTYHTDHWQGDGQTPAAYAGLLAVRFHRPENGWIFWLRREQIHSVRWGGKPEKLLSIGPLGARLTPRGSFEAWEEVVKDHSTPWSETEISVVEQLRNDLVELCLSHASELDRMRQRLIAVLGHDLRNPLQSISMAASLLSSSDNRNQELRQHISTSSDRMERLVGQILDMSRLQSGSGLTVARVATDLSQLVGSIVRETAMAFPGLVIETAIEPGLVAEVDPDRYAQVVANLLGNARHHGKPGKPVLITLQASGSDVLLNTLNEADGLNEAQLAGLFQPFKPDSGSAASNRRGLGLGLYISQSIVKAHHGDITVVYGDGVITFSVSVPVQRPDTA
ncbi:MAG: Bacteriophytochrome [Pseudomonas citronellolis]|nr:MAG: Bacteriophytochrome [Pseudomonas citronellolis]